MKGLNKLALATAVAAAPFAAQAELTAMSDQAMGNTTGQAGVTIELETQIGIDQVEYTQTTDSETTGSGLMNNVSIGGIGDDADSAPYNDKLDLDINVDLASDGSDAATYGSKNLSGMDLNDGDALISLQSRQVDADDDAVPVDMNINLGGTEGNAFQLQSSDGDDTATLMSSLDMDIFLAQLDIAARTGNSIDNDFADSGSLSIDAAFAIDNLDAEFDVAAVGIEGMRMAGVGSLNAAPQAGGLKGPNQGTGAVASNPAVVSMDIAQGERLSGGDSSLRISLDNFQADIWMPTINVGGGANASIGSVGIGNLQVSNTEMAIYGRD